MASREPMTAQVPVDLERGSHLQSAPSKRSPLCCRVGYTSCLAITIALLMPVVLFSGVGVLRTSRKASQVPYLLQLVGDGNVCRKANAAGAFGAVCQLDGPGATDNVNALDSDAFSSLPLDVAVLLFRQVARSDRVVFEEILKGAHVRIPDPDHIVYSFLANLTKPGEQGQRVAYPRPSSHHSDSQQLGLDLGTLLVTMLIGTDGDNTWLQLEADAFKPDGGEVWNNVFHGLDFLMYRATGKNVGPMGLSIHTDKNPLIRHLADSSETCPNSC